MSDDAPTESSGKLAASGSPRAAVLAWSLTALTLLAAGPMVFLMTANGETSLANNLLTAAILLVFAVMGSLVASFRPGNPIGWILCFVALVSLIGNLGVEYGVYGLVRHPGARDRTVAAFGAALRSEVDVSHLNDRLLFTVEETMRPAHVSLWLRTPRPSRQGAAADRGAR